MMESSANRRQFLAAAAATTLGLCAQPRSTQTFLAGLVAGAPRPAGAPVVPQASLTSAQRVEAWWRGCDDCVRLGVHNVEKSTPPNPLVDAYTDRLTDFKEEMSKRHLRLVGLAIYSHTHLTAQRQDLIDEHLRVGRFLKANGGRYITEILAPGPNLGNGDRDSYRNVDVKALINNLNEIGKRVVEETGIELGYHPEEGDSEAGLVDKLMDGTNPKYFSFFPDIGWMTMGGMDALASCKKYRSRMNGIHLRDYAPAAQPGGSLGRMVALGQGVIPLRELIDYMRETKFAGCIMGEGSGNQSNHDFMADTLGLAF